MKLKPQQALTYLYLFAVTAPLVLPRLTNGQVNFSGQVTEIGDDIYGPGDHDIKFVIANIIRVILGFVGTIFLILIIWGGLQWMVSGGNEKKIEAAKKRIVNATIGLVLIVCAYSISSFVVKSLGRALEDTGPVGPKKGG